ncbi:hypothetical protein KY332_01325 [Candidatus Woesearchaeota archaeon]|nr:hypothetical protein [Candidatus Woesearchaeota archaeon]
MEKHQIKDITQYPIVGTDTEIWLIKPENHQRLRLAQSKSGIFDLFISEKLIYHASESIEELTKQIKKGRHRYPKSFEYNYVTIYDTISGKDIRNVHPKGQEQLPIEDRLVDIDFSFTRDGRSLGYLLNGEEHFLFDSIREPVKQDGAYSFSGDRVYFDGKRVAKMDNEIKYFGVVDARELQKMLKRKNRGLLHRWKKL